ncbi:MAG: acetoin utilization protein AcuC [Dehalococcoidia bacterium]|nr:acetoin utilization protein AcuC [Dehalococcoidia bacterium]
MRKTAFLYNGILSQHVLSNTHPMRPIRLQHTYDLLNSYGVFNESAVRLVCPRNASKEELSLIHSQDYIAAVQSLSRRTSEFMTDEYGFSVGGDNPVYQGMYEAATLSTGASLIAAELINSGSVDIAFNIAGGLHHAMRSYASGFCIFNDPAIAIKYLTDQGKRVAYIDVDAHHGDGVQKAFYTNNNVLTISIHESGEYLFPGTGFSNETGSDNADGYSINLPLSPYTNDAVYARTFEQAVIPIVQAFKPDVIVAQLGIDTYHSDPLTHLNITSDGYEKIVQHIIGFNVPLLALGGGGYDVLAVARCWSLAFGNMIGIDLPNKIPKSFAERHNLNLLRDTIQIDLTDDIRDMVNNTAETSIEYIKKNCFPTYKIN